MNMPKYFKVEENKTEIRVIPTDDVAEVKHGKWIDGQCSECGCDVPAYIEDWHWIKDMDAKYCPMCGAKMDLTDISRSERK